MEEEKPIETDSETDKLEKITRSGLYPYDPTYDDIDLKEDPQSVFQYIRKYKQNQLIIDPDFQRNLVWKPEQKSKFIESIILNFPIPPLYVYQNKQGLLTIIDGLQRTSTLIEFLEDKFALTDLEALPKFNANLFSGLPSIVQSKIEDKKLLLYILKPSTPLEVIYDLFNRINTGGTQLNRQEVRNCIFKGKSTKLLKELSKQAFFKESIDYGISPKRMKDQEAILRYLAFRIQGFENYDGDMSGFIENAMKMINNMNESNISDLKVDFERIMKYTNSFFKERNFRIPSTNSRGIINIAVFESISYFFSKTDNEFLDRNRKSIINCFKDLINNSEYLDAVKSTTNAKNKVAARFNLAFKILGGSKL